MLAALLYETYPYQIFKSVLFRAGMGYLTTYFLVALVMPRVIHLFRRMGITSDFKKVDKSDGPYEGATPIMGGIVLILSIIISSLLWAWMNKYTVSLLIMLFSFGMVGLIDDAAKVFHRLRIEAGEEEKKSYADKADGISGKIRLLLEFGVTTTVILSIHYFFGGLDLHLQIPMVPIKTWLPLIPEYIYLPLIILVIVGGSNAVNLTDGLDSLATIPIITSTFFIVAVAYIMGDEVWSSRLKVLHISEATKEVVVFAIILIGAGVAFLKFNSPPAAIYMGDVGSLGLGAVLCTMFVFVKAELYLPFVGAIFVVAALSTIIQRLWFKFALWKFGREWAEKNRFFYRAPYHHHLQTLLTHRKPNVRSVFHGIVRRFGIHKVKGEDRFTSNDDVNNKVIWNQHIKSIWLLVIALIIFFKVR
ncbi:MAG: phospho-N-acetylmuramoyl-pentapeptide-transferase [bacterium]|jgi:phospho-N-acetylmuramoyl-pentapeptide-transferase